MLLFLLVVLPWIEELLVIIITTTAGKGPIIVEISGRWSAEWIIGVVGVFRRSLWHYYHQIEVLLIFVIFLCNFCNFGPPKRTIFTKRNFPQAYYETLCTLGLRGL